MVLIFTGERDGQTERNNTFIYHSTAPDNVREACCLGEFGEVREVWSLGSIGQHQETPVQLTPWHVQIICAVAGAAAARQSPSNAKMDRGVGGAACVGRAHGLV